MKVNLSNVVVLANDYQLLIKWYRDVFELDKMYDVSDEYHYTELGQNGNIIFGIARADEMGKKPVAEHNNFSYAQVAVGDIKLLMSNTEKAGGKVLFGPSEEENFYYGGISDPEGNEIWVIEDKL
jgi:predicted enzyme related to lactoylglutathione lyase